jgi:hypothetical protein
MSSLPIGWEERHVPGPNGRRYYVTPGPLIGTTWVNPLLPINEANTLPRGWDCRVDKSGRWYYFNSHHLTITYEDPRLPQAGKFGPARLQRGNIPSEIWFYGDIPPTAASILGEPTAPILDDALASILDDPSAYSQSPPGPLVASMVGSQPPPIHQKARANSNVTVPDMESLPLPPSRSQTKFQTRENSPIITDGSDMDRAPHPQIYSNGSQPVLNASTEPGGNQRTPESEQQLANTQPASKSEPQNDGDTERLGASPKNGDSSLTILAKPLTRTQHPRNRRKCQAKSILKHGDPDNPLEISSKSTACEISVTSAPAKDPTPTQRRRARRKARKLFGKPHPGGALSARRVRHSLDQTLNPDRNTVSFPQPTVPPESTLDNSLPCYRLVRAYGDPSGAVKYHLLAAMCVAEEVAPHYTCLTWYTGGLHHHAVVDSHRDHVRTSEKKLDSFHRGLETYLDADYLIIEFPDRMKHCRNAVNYIMNGQTYTEAELLRMQFVSGGWRRCRVRKGVP